MSDYSRSKKNCTNKGKEHTWSDIKTRNVQYDVVYRNGEPFLKIKYEKYRTCETEMQYHAGRSVGLTTGRVCEIENDVESVSWEVELEKICNNVSL